MSSSDDHNRNKSKKKASKTRTGINTPIGQIELEPDAFRGAMNPENLSSNANRDIFLMAELLPVVATILMTFHLAMSQKI